MDYWSRANPLLDERIRYLFIGNIIDYLRNHAVYASVSYTQIIFVLNLPYLFTNKTKLLLNLPIIGPLIIRRSVTLLHGKNPLISCILSNKYKQYIFLQCLSSWDDLIRVVDLEILLVFHGTSNKKSKILPRHGRSTLFPCGLDRHCFSSSMIGQHCRLLLLTAVHFTV